MHDSYLKNILYSSFFSSSKNKVKNSSLRSQLEPIYKVNCSDGFKW